MRKQLSSEKGMIIVWLLLAVTVIPFVLLAFNHQSGFMLKVSTYNQMAGTKQQMETAKSLLINRSADPDADATYEPLAPAIGLVPASVPVNAKDKWNNDLLYCAWDSGSVANGNSDYSQNRDTPPIDNLVIRLASAGPDGVLQTACDSPAANGDDIVSDTLHAEIVNAKGGLSLPAVDYEAEVAVSAARTLGLAELGRSIVCSGGGYVVTLPDATGCNGKIVSLRMDNALVGMVTIDGLNSQQIDGASERLLWAGESAVLRSNGTGWNKIGGVTKPLVAKIMADGSGQTVLGASPSVVDLPVAVEDSAGMVDTANSRIVIKRNGTYAVSAAGAFNSAAMADYVFGVMRYVGMSGTAIAQTEDASTSDGEGGYRGAWTTSGRGAFNVGDYARTEIYLSTAGDMRINEGNTLEVTEIPGW